MKIKERKAEEFKLIMTSQWIRRPYNFHLTQASYHFEKKITYFFLNRTSLSQFFVVPVPTVHVTLYFDLKLTY